MTKVFVYGTLKRGHGNNSLLGSSRYLGEYITLHKYSLTNCGFPYMSEETLLPKKQVLGEVFEVNDWVLEHLDILEGVKYNHYQRKNIVVANLVSLEVETVFAYLADKDTAEDYPLCSVVNNKYMWP